MVQLLITNRFKLVLLGDSVITAHLKETGKMPNWRELLIKFTKRFVKQSNTDLTTYIY